MSDCIFCKIASGQIPAKKIMETDDAIAFLDVGPLAPGHVLLIPKRHYNDIRDAPAEAVQMLCGHLPRLGRAVMQATGTSGLNVLQNTGRSSGQAVFHLHFHLIPRREGDTIGYRWNAGSYAEGQAEAMQSKLVIALAT